MAVWFCGFVWLGPLRDVRRVRVGGRLVLWRICGAVVGRRGWSEGLDAALEKYQSGDDHNGPPYSAAPHRTCRYMLLAL